VFVTLENHPQRGGRGGPAGFNGSTSSAEGIAQARGKTGLRSGLSAE